MNRQKQPGGYGHRFPESMQARTDTAGHDYFLFLKNGRKNPRHRERNSLTYFYGRINSRHGIPKGHRQIKLF
jgi:hypothetical protein